MAPHVVPPVPSRQKLEAMKRVDLQRLCKDYGVRANLKSEALVDLLLETSKPNTRSVPPMVRSVSTRRMSRSAGRVSSMIIHESGEQPVPQPAPVNLNENTQGQPSEQSQPRTRTSKAYATQTRLGVGRPVAAGGGGARAVTKSLSISKKRGKGSRSMNPKETTIAEEPEPEEYRAGPSGTMHTPPHMDTTVATLTPPAAETQQSRTLDERIAEAIAPLQRQLQTLKADLEQMNGLKAEIDRLKSQVAFVGPLKDSVASLTAEISTLRGQSVGNLLPSFVIDVNDRAAHNAIPSLLGKRHRNSTGSEDSDVLDHDQDLETDQGFLRPQKKRQRLGDVDKDFPKTPPNHPQSLPPHVQPDDVLRRDDHLGTPPPLDRLPELYGTPSSPPERKREAGAFGNAHPFNFTFNMPVPPTPNPAFTMPFAYPEAPQSPTPVPHTRSRLLGAPRADILQAFRRSSMERTRQSESNAESSHGLGTFLNEAALDRDSDQVLLADIDILDPEGASPSKRTMYGTEMETDSRFGDFGFEGVNPPFWAPKF